MIIEYQPRMHVVWYVRAYVVPTIPGPAHWWASCSVHGSRRWAMQQAQATLYQSGLHLQAWVCIFIFMYVCILCVYVYTCVNSAHLLSCMHTPVCVSICMHTRTCVSICEPHRRTLPCMRCKWPTHPTASGVSCVCKSACIYWCVTKVHVSIHVWQKCMYLFMCDKSACIYSCVCKSACIYSCVTKVHVSIHVWLLTVSYPGCVQAFVYWCGMQSMHVCGFIHAYIYMWRCMCTQALIPQAASAR